MARDREERRMPACDAGRRVTEYTSNDRKSLNVPAGLGLWKPKKTGPYKVEFIPYAVTKSILGFKMKRFAEPGQGYYERTYWLHAGVGANKDSFVCTAKTFGKPCAICDYRGKLLQSPSKENEEIAYANRPKERQLFLLVDHAEPEKGIQLAEISTYCLGKQLDDKINNADDEDRARYRKFADAEEGSTVKLAASEESMGDGGRKFLWFNVDEFRVRKQPLDPDWLEHEFNLDDMVREADYAEVKAAFLQTGADDDDPPAKPKTRSRDDDDDPPPRTSRAAKQVDADDDPPPAKKKVPPADDDDPPPRKPAKIEWGKDNVGDEVCYEYKDKTLTGTIVKVDTVREVIHIEVEGKDKPAVVDMDDVTPAPKKEKSKTPPPDDDDTPPAKKKAAPVDDDDPPPAKKRTAADDDDEPAPKKKPAAKSDWDDDDDDRSFKRKPAAADDDDDPPPAKKRK